MNNIKNNIIVMNYGDDISDDKLPVTLMTRRHVLDICNAHNDVFFIFRERVHEWMDHYHSFVLGKVWSVEATESYAPEKEDDTRYWFTIDMAFFRHFIRKNISPLFVHPSHYCLDSLFTVIGKQELRDLFRLLWSERDRPRMRWGLRLPGRQIRHNLEGREYEVVGFTGYTSIPESQSSGSSDETCNDWKF